MKIKMIAGCLATAFLFLSVSAAAKKAPVPPPKYVPLGANIEAYGYVLTPSEKLEFLYRPTAKNPPQTVLMEYVLRDLSGKAIKQGEAAGTGIDGGTKYRFPIADTPAFLEKDGTYRLETRIKGETDWFPYAFTFLSGAPDAEKVVCLFDNMDPEGWGELLVSPLKHRPELLKSFPADGKADLVLLACHSIPETQSADTARRIGDWVKRGGTLIAWGEVNETFADLLPVVLRPDPDSSYLNFGKSSRLTVTDAGKKLLKSHDRWSGSEYPQLHCTPAKGAVVLATYADGNPALVMKKTGKGAVFFFCGELVRGALFNDLYGTALKKNAEAAPDREETPGSFSETSIGRYGYNIEIAGMLLRNYDREKNMFGMWNNKILKLTFPGSGGEEHCRVLDTNWCYRRYEFSGGPWGGGAIFHSPLCSMHMTVEPAAEQKSFVLGFPENVKYDHGAYRGTSGIKVFPLAGNSFRPEDMQANWLLLWGTEREATAPLLLVFAAPPRRMDARKEGLEFTFSEPLKFLSFTCPDGLKLFNREVVEQWKNTLPGELVRKIDSLSRMMVALPVKNTETYQVTQSGVEIRNHFEFKTFSDKWNTVPLYFAPYPPVAALAAAAGMPVKLENQAEFLSAAVNGPVCGVVGAEECSFTLPRVDYPYPLRTEKPSEFFRDKTADLLRRRAGEYLSYALPRGIYYGHISYNTPYAFYTDDIASYDGTWNDKNLFECKLFDFYRRIGMTFGMLQFLPYFTPEYADVARQAARRLEIDRTGLGFFKYKTLVRHRREPYTGRAYNINFIFPISYTPEGFRIFNDNNESFGLALYGLYMDGLLGGDWETVKAAWPMIDVATSYPKVFNDWAFMASYAKETSNANNIDMINSEYPGWLGYTKIAEKLGRHAEAEFGNYAAAKTAVSTVARLYYPQYLRGIVSNLSPENWRNSKFCTGWGVNFGITEPPSAVNGSAVLEGGFAGFRKIAAQGMDLWDTSKGTAPEMALIYDRLGGKAIRDYEDYLWDKIGFFGVWPRLSYRAMLGADSKWLREKTEEYSNSPLNTPEKLTFQTIYTPNYLAMILEGYLKSVNSEKKR